MKNGGAKANGLAKRFRPRLMDSIKGYDRPRFIKDTIAGITVGVVALPLAMAFAIASGLQPQVGLFTAIIAGFLISALGGSSVQIGGPAGAFIVVVLGIVQQYGIPNLIICTIFAGALLVLMGMTGLGSLVRLVPVSIVIGFTNGIAVLIALSQIKDFLGLTVETPTGNFFSKNLALIESLPSYNPEALALAFTCFLIIMIWPKAISAESLKVKRNAFVAILTRIPASVMVLVGGTAVAYLLNLQVETIGSRFGEIPRGLPELTMPFVELENIGRLIAPTLTIAFLCAIESLLCARVADGLIRERHDPNQELIAQGIANIASPLFGGMPATGTIARTVTNIRSGATSPISGMIHAATLLLIVLLAAPLAGHIPLCVLSAILMYVAWNMGEWREFARLRQFTVVYRITLLSTFFLTVIVDLTVAVEVGLILAAVFFIYRVSTLTEFKAVQLDEDLVNSGVKAYQIYGALFFAVVGKIERLLVDHHSGPSVLLLDMHQVISVDTTALEALEELQDDLHLKGGVVVFCGLNNQAKSLFKRSGFEAKLKPHQLQVDLSAGIQWASNRVRQAGH